MIHDSSLMAVCRRKSEWCRHTMDIFYRTYFIMA